MRLPFFRETDLLLVAGKGGVGTSTVATAIAHAAAADGDRVALVRFGIPSGENTAQSVETATVTVITLDAQAALVEWLNARRFAALAKRLASTGALDVVATAVPGMHDILLLGRVKALVNSASFNRVVVDCPGSGHAVAMLGCAAALRETVGGGAIRQQADEVYSLITDPARTQVVLVTLAAATPVTETIETAFDLEDRLGLRLGPVVVNRVLQRCPDNAPSALPRGSSEDASQAGLRLLIERRNAATIAQSAAIARLRKELPLPTIDVGDHLRHATDVTDSGGLIRAIAADLASTASIDATDVAVTAASVISAATPSARAPRTPRTRRGQARHGESDRNDTSPASSDGPEVPAGDTSPTAVGLTAKANTARVIVTVGTGGVGKTTCAAALALAQAAAGRRCVVLTIDPARRLAEVLGLTEQSVHGDGAALGFNEPSLVDIAAILNPAILNPNVELTNVELTNVGSAEDDSTTGALWACMLDTQATFDAAIRREAGAEQAEAILKNPLYRSLSRSLPGTHEYMAAERVQQLLADDRFDVVVVDTPPAQHALDFVSAPRRLVRFLEHPLFRAVAKPGRGARRALASAVAVVISPLTQIVGGAIVADAVEFFGLFDGLEVGFAARARSALDHLTGPDAMWLLVATSEPESVADALEFAHRATAAGVRPSGAVLNRAEPSFGTLGEARRSSDRNEQFIEELVTEHRARRSMDRSAQSLLSDALGVPAGLVSQVVPQLTPGSNEPSERALLRALAAEWA